jgi:hypothetical protein
LQLRKSIESNDLTDDEKEAAKLPSKLTDAEQDYFRTSKTDTSLKLIRSAATHSCGDVVGAKSRAGGQSHSWA